MLLSESMKAETCLRGDEGGEGGWEEDEEEEEEEEILVKNCDVRQLSFFLCPAQRRLTPAGEAEGEGEVQ